MTQNAGDHIAQLNQLNIEALHDDQEQRMKALELSKKLTAALEGPVNRATELVFKPFISIAARIAVGLDLFSPIVSAPAEGISSKELAAITARILRVMASVSFVEERGLDLWAPNETTQAMASAPIAAGHRFVYDIIVSSAIKAPKYLKETGYRCPSEPTDGFIQYANQTKLNVFDYLGTMPSLFADFNLFMGNTLGSRLYWHDWYDVPGRLLNGFDASKSSALLVDVGAGKGHDLVAFDEKFGGEDYQGELVLQDLLPVLDDIPEDALKPKIRREVQDFFMEQKTKGARAYFLHHILHDWSDKYCHLILKNLHAAMIPGYSKLLIHDLILPDTGAVEIQARFDLTMMSFNGGVERSRSQWKSLLEEAGFVNVRLWEYADGDGIVEAEVGVERMG